MCDSFVALGNSTRSGSVLLAKSADTEVNEAEQVVRYPRRHYAEGALARITHRTIPQVPVTHQVILGRSFWAWGSELGCNELGVSVGNEAAFSNQPSEADGACCLDLCRLSVERGGTALEAVKAVGAVVEAFGQGGNCQMMGNYPFDTGLLIGDRHEAYVVNCAGRHWAARKVDDVMAISNRYQITDDWGHSSLQAENGAKPNFREQFADEVREAEVAALARECRALELLQSSKGSITVKDMADILRDVGEDSESYNIPDDELPDRICMHAGPFEARFWHATGAMITDSSEEGVCVWMTATSATDLSVFKPLFFEADMPDTGPLPRGTFRSTVLACDRRDDYRFKRGGRLRLDDRHLGDGSLGLQAPVLRSRHAGYGAATAWHLQRRTTLVEARAVAPPGSRGLPRAQAGHPGDL